ncbi:NUDIX hydrolase [Gordonia shandongensis]|uniref:NUDIX hydrolase n=1 Tax=Gordonia shandongensis TaxID=376351 RepID=UPI00041E782F|nr:NUDIX domain-containing protein [Gordonia shandongensis]
MVTGPIVVSAVVLRDERGRVVTVRKRGTSSFMFPGGKIDAGESAADAAVREVREELGVDLERDGLTWLGDFHTPAANEPGRSVRATVFSHALVGSPAPRSEIVELAWVDPADPSDLDLAPLLRDAVFPALVADRR